MSAGLKCAVACATAALVALVPATARAAYPGSNGKIAFARDGQIWTMDPDGTGQLQVTTDVLASYEPQWSPDGARILYTRGSGDQAQTRVMNADGGADSIVSGPGPYGTRSPTWSPDGRRVAFVERRFDFIGCECWIDDIVESDVDGSGKRRISQGNLTGWGLGPAAGLTWSPKGNEVGFTNGSWEDVTAVAAGVVDGSAQTLAGNPCCYDAYFGGWSPDATKVAFVRNDIGTESFQLYTVNRDGSALTHLSGLSGLQPDWSPDGSKLVYSTGTAIHVVLADGSGDTPITNTPGHDSQPDWQPVAGDPYPGYPRSRGATPLRVPLVPAYQPCVAANRTHGPPLAFPSCHPPARASTALTVGTPDANGAAANSVGHVLLDVRPGDPATAVNEAEVFMSVSVTDVRCVSTTQTSDCTSANSTGGRDFYGQLRATLSLRVTDRYNLPSRGGRQAGTVVDTPLRMQPGCAITPDASRGSTCALSTTANALQPGVVVEGRRSSWEVGQVHLRELDDTLFATQGVFIP